MRKIKTLFRRDPDDPKHVLPVVTPGCEWVSAGEGTATRKWDGTCVLVRGGAMFARREVKPGKEAPLEFELCETDPATGKSVGWVPVTDASEYARHWEAWLNGGARPDGTYELIGPKVNGNPEAFQTHALVPHGNVELTGVPLDFDGLARYLLDHPGREGIVWWRELGNPDAGLAKLKRRDFE